ncbi:MAG: hypothetical protein HeimC3_54660 [Candidatus Heimdallarchaeota archaeon LC_3]|nr:MAG: hypothetical protein HeimC3_54660 [Candidatus Heimdallarchaeota archaeon LC_3]
MSNNTDSRIANLEKKILELTLEISNLKKEKNNQARSSTTQFQSSVDFGLSLASLEKEVNSHQDILKNQTKIMITFSDFIKNIRETFQESVSDFREDQISLMKSFQNIVSSTSETLRTEFLMVLRDFREKYPELEKIKIEKELKQIKSPFPTIDSSQIFTSDQATFLDRKFDELIVQIERQIQDSFVSVVELLSHILAKVEELKYVLEEKNVKIEEL